MDRNDPNPYYDDHVEQSMNQNQDSVKHEEKVVGGNSNFMELLEKEMQKQGINNKVVEQEVEVPKTKPKKEFLKKGKKVQQIQQKELENKNKKNIESELNDSTSKSETPKKRRNTTTKEKEKENPKENQNYS